MVERNWKMGAAIVLTVLVVVGVGRFAYLGQLQEHRFQLMSQCSAGGSVGIKSCTELIKYEPDNATAYSQRAFAHQVSGEHQRAISDYENALRVQPNHVFSLLNRGRLYGELKQYEPAIRDFSTVITMPLSEGFSTQEYRQDASRGRAEAYEALGKYKLAIADYTKLIQHDPEAGWIAETRGRLYYKAGHYGKAVKDFTALLRGSPNSSFYLFGRGQAYYKKKDYQRAITDFNRVIEIAPRHIAAILYRADIFAATGQKGEAIVELQKAVALDPSFHPARRMLKRLKSEVSAAPKF
ncbi:MAG: tetratricopeptide repeat protein [Filomicrobium sp.]